jgi:hypothetical protein
MLDSSEPRITRWLRASQAGYTGQSRNAAVAAAEAWYTREAGPAAVAAMVATAEARNPWAGSPRSRKPRNRQLWRRQW